MARTPSSLGPDGRMRGVILEWPREHGAYAQLAAPLVAALVVRVPTASAVLLALAAAAAFLANEPLLVALGHRGPRLREAIGGKARRRCLVLGCVAVVAGTSALAVAREATLASAAVPLALAIALIALAYRRGQHSVVGETVAAFALPAAAVPVAVASGVMPASALVLWAAWSVGFAASVAAVHRVIHRNRRSASYVDRVLAGACASAVAAAVAIACVEPRVAVALPLLGISLGLLVWPPKARYLRRIGVALVVAASVSVFVAVGSA